MKIAKAYFEITNICNLNCRSCYNRSGLNPVCCEMPASKLIESVKRLNTEFGCESISLSGGEPTLHSEFEGILESLGNLPVHISVVTNGTTDCSSLVNAHREGKIDIQVSLDGSNEAVNAKTRGEGNFDRAVEFISKLGKLNPPHMKMVVSKKNFEDVPAYYSFAAELGCVPVFGFISQSGNADEVWEDLELSAKEKLGVLKTVDRLNRESGLNVDLPRCTSSCPLVDTDGEKSVLIKSNGDVFPCQMLYDEKFKVGNILTSSAGQLKTAFAHIANLARQRCNADFGCDKCVARTVCARGCMAAANQRTGDPLGDDGECMFRKLQLVGFDLPNSK